MKTNFEFNSEILCLRGTLLWLATGLMGGGVPGETLGPHLR